MDVQEEEGDFVAVPKDTLKCMMNDFEHLLEDFESIAEAESMRIAKKRLAEIENGKVKPLTEKEFKELMKKQGIMYSPNSSSPKHLSPSPRPSRQAA